MARGSALRKSSSGRPEAVKLLTLPAPRRAAAIVLTLALAPAVVVLLLRLPLINQLDYADPWFYSSYGWVPKQQFALFGFNYFAARFPAILLIGGFQRAFGVHEGYLLLRYLLAVASGGAVYGAVRRFARPGTALASAVLLYLSPFFSRMLLWDYSYFLAVSAGMVGLGLWWWADGRRLAWSLVSGVALGAAIFAHALFGFTIIALTIVESTAAVRSGWPAVRRIAARLGLCLVGSLAVFVTGYLSYAALLGWFAPYDLLRPTLRFLGDAKAQVAAYALPHSVWLFHEPRLWGPVILSVALCAVLGREILGITLPARIAQLCVTYTCLLWIYDTVAASSVVQQWYSYSLAIVVMAPAVGVLLEALRRRRVGVPTARFARSPVLAVVVTAVTAAVIRYFPAEAERCYAYVSRRPWADLGVLGLGSFAAFALGRPSVRSEAARVAAFAALLTVTAFAPSVEDTRGGTGVFVADGTRDWIAYQAGFDLIHVIRSHTAHGRHVLLWYPDTGTPVTAGLANIAWTYLPQSGLTVQELGLPTSLATLAPLGRARLLLPDSGAVLVMSPSRVDLVTAVRALRQNGFVAKTAAHGDLGRGRLHYELDEIVHKPS